jgi:hypothetical protein
MDQLDEELREAFVEPIEALDMPRPRTASAVHTTDHKTLCFKPIQVGIVFQCRVSRTVKFQPEFELFLEDSVGGERYLMSAVRKMGSDPRYVIYYKDPISERETVLGCVRL